MAEPIKLTNEQQKLVEDNIGLVRKVIADRVSAPDRLGIFTREDLFQIGCEGLCKASACFKTNGEGRFSTYAYRVIYNQICDAMRYATLRTRREIVKEQEIQETYPVAGEPASLMPGDVYSTLAAITSSASRPIRNGAKAMVMRAEGFSSSEICKMLDASPGKIRMWISRARRYLIEAPEVKALAA